MMSEAGNKGIWILVVALVIGVGIALIWVGDSGGFRKDDGSPLDDLTTGGNGGDPILGVNPSTETIGAERNPLPPHPMSGVLGSGQIEPDQEVEIVGAILEAYREAFGSFPTAEDNRGVITVLLGANPESRMFIASDSPGLSEQGELLDAYGNPYFFHFLSSEAVEVRSAGRDREFYTADDVVWDE